VPFSEPYKKRTAQGLLLGEDGEKMSKSRGNVVNPDKCMDRYGADVLRTFILFIGDYERPAPWSDSGISGSRRFMERVWKLQDIMTSEEGYSEKHNTLTHKLIKKVNDDFENSGYNTAIAAMMGYINEIYADGYVTKGELMTLLKLLYPVAPHITEEINQLIGGKTMLCDSSWPKYIEEYLVEDVLEIPVQICGKLKGVISIQRDSDIGKVKEVIAASGLASLFEGKTVVKEIFVPNKIVNFILK
ncbi:MAG: leucine--tRNA ligase, partial [Clostridia bacterium]|nr:leucine--tRNA ligase [Clostridia bacterium]